MQFTNWLIKVFHFLLSFFSFFLLLLFTSHKFFFFNFFSDQWLQLLISIILNNFIRGAVPTQSQSHINLEKWSVVRAKGGPFLTATQSDKDLTTEWGTLHTHYTPRWHRKSNKRPVSVSVSGCVVCQSQLKTQKCVSTWLYQPPKLLLPITMPTLTVNFSILRGKKKMFYKFVSVVQSSLY